ncbi:MAG: DUF262 domain-containing HNH endonuclease family protein [Prevotellaceae bacterium]|jgi:citrate synthase|nr:DUF262 domain-containing HNH endonuclease family protein [Prevotellaceae bacterium]
MVTEIKTFEYTPKELIDKNHFFAIPIYQRLYAWGEEQIIKLLEDLYSSFQANPNKDYFIGNWVIYQKSENERYDIIDGQQRMTTLWLMGFVLKQYHSNWNSFLFDSNNQKLRLDFIAREGDSKFLMSLFALIDKTETNINKLIDEVKTQKNIAENVDSVNSVMVSALKFINEFVINIDDKEKFANFVFEHTKFVGILLPNGTDLNKYFEVMNNRGVQLEKHEILKARMLLELPEAKRQTYANIWDACANTSVYIESFVSSSNKNQIADFAKNTSINDDFIRIFQNENTEQKKNLSELLKELDEAGARNTSEIPQSKDSNTDDSERYISIVKFSGFLLYVLRLIKNNSSIKIEDKDLISIFNEEFFKGLSEDNKETKTIEFLNELLCYRILFDKYVIKSILKDGDSLWQIRELKAESDGSYIRHSTSDNKNLEMVESFLQVSTQQDIWLSLLLKKIKTEEVTSEDLIEYLEYIDCLLAKERLEKNSQRTVFEQLFKNEQIETIETYSDWAFLDNGTSTPRYWFFKLDYLLWKDKNINKLDKKSTFQFRQNRSVEHVHAQSQNNEINNEWNEKEIDSFGNLALISVNSNSQNNDNNFDVKKAYFKQRTEKYGYESLKLALIFENDNWTKEKCEEHRKSMIEKLKESL